jgi:hypothetical protein
VVVWARASGYAWGHLEVDFQEGGERLLVLLRGADLEVTVVNRRPGERSPLLRLWAPPKPDPPQEAALSFDELRGAVAAAPKNELPEGLTREELLAELEEQPGNLVVQIAPRPDRPTLIDGLAPGSYILRAELGEWFEEPLVLASLNVELSAGERKDVVVELASSPSLPKAVPLAGTLSLPLAWGEQRITLLLKPTNLPQLDAQDWLRISLDDMEPDVKRPGLYLWSAGDVVPAKYEAEIFEFALKLLIDVGTEGQRDAEIRIAEPAEVAVIAVDAETGGLVEADDLDWNCVRPKGIKAGGVNSAQRSPQNGEFSFRAPAGLIEISLWPDGYASHRQVIEVRPGPNQVKLRLEKSCGLIVSVREGEQVLPYDLVREKLQVNQVGGLGYVAGRSGDKNVRRLTVSQPGIYEISVSKLNGYEPVRPVQVQIGQGQFVQHVIVLRRER